MARKETQSLKRRGRVSRCTVAGLLVLACVLRCAPALAEDPPIEKDPPKRTIAEGGGSGSAFPDAKTLEKIIVTGNRISTDVQDTFPMLGAYFDSGGANLGTGGDGGGFGGSFSSNNKKDSTTNKRQSKNKCEGRSGDPVVIADGSKVFELPLFALPGEMGLRYALYYHSKRNSSPWADNPWSSSISYVLDQYCGDTAGCNKITLYRPDGSSLSFSGARTSHGSFPEIGGGGLATLTHNADETWTLHDEDATVQTYDPFGSLASIKDASGIGWAIAITATVSPAVSPDLGCEPLAQPVTAQCDPPLEGPPPPTIVTTTTTVTHTNGQHFTIVSVVNYPGARGTVTITDPAGNHYVYSATGGFEALSRTGRNITSLTFPGSPATTMSFTYTGSNYDRLSEMAYNGVSYWSTAYDSNGRVINDGAADGTEQTSFSYAFPSGQTVATIVNPLGMTTTETYAVNSQGFSLLTKVTNSAVLGCGASANTLAWDANNNLTKTVDNNGVTHTYAATGQLQTDTEASGTSLARKTDYAWDANKQLNRLLSVTVEGETKITYTYDSHNRLASMHRINLTSIGTANQSIGHTYAYTLYSNGTVHTLKVATSSPGGTDWVTYTYDSHGNLVSAANALGHTATWSNYNGLGQPGKGVGPNGDETDYTYDGRGRVVGKTTHPNGGTATWTYAYDGFGLPAKLTAPDGQVITWARDAEMRVRTITHNDKDGTSSETFAYDAAGNVISDVVKRGSDVGKSQTYVYNALGKIYQVKGSHGQSLTYAYDGNLNVLSVTDALGHKTRYAYDAVNRVTTVTDAANGVTRFAYDMGDHVVKVTDPRGLITTYSYDGLGLLWKQISPDTGTTTFSYDAYGRRNYMWRANGNLLGYSYDTINRLTKVTAGSQSQTFTWDACTGGKNRLCKVADAHSTVSYTYSPEGWMTGRYFAITSAASYSLKFHYNAMGQLDNVTYPDGNQAIYDYSRGAVYQVRVKIGATTICCAVASVTYRPMDLAMSKWTSHGGLTNTIAFDSDLRPTSISVPNVESLAFTYDAADRITRLTNGLDSSMTQTFGYDALDRLINVSSGADHESYSYDADGNRLNAVINGVTWTYTTSSTSNRLVHASNGSWSGPYQYDVQGNTLGTTHQYWTYDVFNRMRTAIPLAGSPITTYDVNPEGQRLRKYTSSTHTYFAPAPDGALLAEYTSGWTDHVRLNGRLVAVVKGGAIYPVHTDQTGRPEAITDVSHSILWRARNLAFDRTVITDVWGEFNVGFPGQYNDDDDIGAASYWNNGQRDYSAKLGRYLQSDPIGLAGGINTYVYVGNNPISFVDPLGLQCTLLQRIGNAIGNFLNDHTQLELAFDAGDGLGASGDITITNSGIYGRFGVGVGIGWGVSLSGGGHIGHESGLDVTASATGGDGVGGTVQGTASQGGLGGTGSLGFGVEGGVTATIGYGGKIANLPAALSHGHSSGCGCH